MNIKPPAVMGGCERVPWVVVTWKWKQVGPGGQTVPQQSKGAIVFPDMRSAQLWLEEAVASGKAYSFDFFVGDPAYSGVPGVFEYSVDQVWKAPGVSQ